MIRGAAAHAQGLGERAYSPDFYLEAGDAVYVDGTVGMSLKGVLGVDCLRKNSAGLRPVARQGR